MDGEIIKTKNGIYKIESKNTGYGLTYFYKYNDGVLNIKECGWEVCPKKHICKNVKKDYYVLHYIVKGSGYYEINGKKYQLNAFTGFLLPPNVNLTYYADEKNPWQYYWVGIQGSLVEQLLKTINIGANNNYIFITPYKEETIRNFERLYKLSTKFPSRDLNYYASLGCLYEIIAYLSNATYNTDIKSKEITEKIIQYINLNYHTTTVNDLQKIYFIDRSYIYKIIKKATGVSPAQYILNLKLQESLLLLKDTKESINNIAYLVGFNGSINFCVQFKKKFGLTPSEYRKKPFEK